MVTSLQIITSALTGQPLLSGADRVAHRAKLVANMDQIRSADPAYMLPHNVFQRKWIDEAHEKTMTRLRAEHPEWSESKLEWEATPYNPERLVSVGKDKDGTDFLVSESDARGRWAPYRGMNFE